MKIEMSSFDVLAVANELKNLRGARLNKVYQVSPQELKIQLNVRELGKQELVIEAGKRIHLTEYPKPSPEKPSTFAMTLRKYLENAVLTEVKQVSFDRIVELSFKKDEEEFELIGELFGKGNIILTDKNYKILAVMKPQKFKARSLVGREKYVRPPPRLNPFEVSKDGLKRIINESKSAVKTLASPLGLGGLYAEELCLRAGIEKNKEKITDEEASEIYNTIAELKNSIGRERPAVVFDDSTPIDLVPFKLKIYEGKKIKEFDSFNKAADEYFTKYEIERVEGLRNAEFEKEISKLEARLQEQIQTLEKYREAERLYRQFGDLIYAHFKSIESILKALSNARKTHSWDEIAKKIEEDKEKTVEASMIKKLLPKEGALIVELDGTEVRLDMKKSTAHNADFYYGKSKKAREKTTGVEESMRNTEAKIRELKERGREAIALKEKKPEKRKARKKDWYEKFRWFISSDNFLVLGGRDAATNEILVKKHMSSNDVFVHADIHGAPAVVIKTEGREIPEATMQEAFDFAASYSKAWKHNIFGLDVYWVAPEQVSKTAEHGEYIAKGAFVIRGKKNFGKGKIEVAVGVKLDETIKVIGGPTSAIEKQAKYFVKIIPGKMKSKEIAETIKSKLLGKASEEDREKIRGIAFEEIQEFLPGGGGEVKE
ncbi:MAG: ribosome rescue protein RqcH [Methanobacteriota archaeon]